ncbi:MAG: DUF2442 domain-containing protein [Thermoanaerobaculia bacterium]
MRVHGRPLARGVEISDNEISVELADGRRISAPLVWFPRLLAADANERQNWELLGDDDGMHWPAIVEDLSVAGLLAGARSHSRPVKRAG